MNNDPWVNRSDNMKCKTCIWFVPKASILDNSHNVGRCRRHAPSMGGYPVVMINDWCGDHRIDENKIAKVEQGCVANTKVQPDVINRATTTKEKDKFNGIGKEMIDLSRENFVSTFHSALVNGSFPTGAERRQTGLHLRPAESVLCDVGEY